MTKMIFEIDCIQAGQPRPYADSEYVYIIKNNSEIEYTQNVIERLCTSFVYTVKPKSDPTYCYFDGSWTLTKIDNRTFKYHVTQPFTD
jgi:hypothetical protein